jgi:hypothetical protein
VPLAGARGGGFLFDTNALHAAAAEGDAPRSVVVVELDRESRCADLHEIASQGAGGARYRAPCPSDGQHPLSASPIARGEHGGGGGLLPHSAVAARSGGAASAGGGRVLAQCRHTPTTVGPQ